MTTLIQAQTPEEIEMARRLMREYQAAIGVDLCFQGFERELQMLPGAYAPPSGRLFIAMHENVPVGCIALQRISDARGEIKRLYVQPQTRGLGIGRALVSTILTEAKAIGYVEVVLDTLVTMTAALQLYEQFGFRDIEPYRHNPLSGARYLGKTL